MNAPVSALVITYNEEAKIERCLASLTWANEIVVIDAFSTDSTPALCESMSKPWAGKLRFIQRAWTGFRDQRNHALAEAKNPWVLVLDADEECSIELKEKIISFFQNSKQPPHSAYKIKRVEYFLGKPILYGIWNPSYQDRFFQKIGVKYTNEVHEYPVFTQQPQQLHEPIHHDPSFNPERFLKKMNHYTSIEALDRYRQGQRTNFFRMLFAFPAMFLKNYFYYGAYKDGFHGFAISLLEGVSRVVRHVKIWQIQNESRSHNA